ncbi:ABC transporter [Trypanosoma brucei equiperdum]|uniref:ABC transporter n=1 Tax=Trypanosoma brucei equiperdum TaxID=630700 RepID=A0A3L6KS58_9TRYP|nr:ABC transporter [Trypanosoma brucei equiperdum]
MVGEEVENVVTDLLYMCDLTKYRKSLAGELSGGNRRKLSLAVALVGGPGVIFLDEPTAGMDPIARRKIWSVIERAACQCAVVLTTHHLEEVEALAHRVAIMKDGTMRCVGRNAHLKDKYGAGYEMHICVAEGELPALVREFVDRQFAGATLRECKGRQLVYALPRSTSLADAFRTLESSKGLLGIVDYSVSQQQLNVCSFRSPSRMNGFPNRPLKWISSSVFSLAFTPNLNLVYGYVYINDLFFCVCYHFAVFVRSFLSYPFPLSFFMGLYIYIYNIYYYYYYFKLSLLPLGPLFTYVFFPTNLCGVCCWQTKWNPQRKMPLVLLCV